MKDLHADKRAYNTALYSAMAFVNECENAKRFVVKENGRYLTKKEATDYISKVEFKDGKINVTKKESPKLKKAAKKVSRKLQDTANEAAD